MTGAVSPAVAAAQYASRDLNVLPLWWPNTDGRCACGGQPGCRSAKHPIGLLAPRAHASATHDLTTVDKWWDAFPKANLGIELARSGVAVIDFDRRAGADESDFDIRREFGGWPQTWTHSTGDGTHLMFVRPPGIDLRVLNLAPGIDLMGAGYVVSPPSVHANGWPYVWEVTGDPSDDAPLAQLPAWIIDRLSEATTGSTAQSGDLLLNCGVQDGVDPSMQLVSLLMNDPKIRDIWTKENPSLRRTDLSDSAWTFSLALSLFWRRFSDQAVVDGMVSYREHIGAQPKPASWFLRTCSRAKSNYLDYRNRNTRTVSS